MSMVARKFTHVTANDYLLKEKVGVVRHEYVNGAVYAMSGASAAHNLIRGNASAYLLTSVSDPCFVFSAEMKLQVKTNEEERYYYPDIFVSCDPADNESYGTAVLVIEVLSPTTERIDRTEKFEAYTRKPDLLEYGLLSQDAMELELFRRRNKWQRELFLGDDIVTFESINVTTNVSRFYRRVFIADVSGTTTI